MHEQRQAGCPGDAPVSCEQRAVPARLWLLRLGTYSPSGSSTCTVEWAWCPRLFPYIEQQALADIIAPYWSIASGSSNVARQANPQLQAVYESNIATWQCPSDPMITDPFDDHLQFNPNGFSMGRCSYAACLGVGQMEGTIVPPPRYCRRAVWRSASASRGVRLELRRPDRRYQTARPTRSCCRN